MSVSKHLSNYLETNNISLKDLANKTNLPLRTLQSYIQETRQPTTPALTVLAEKTDININWLLTGKGNMLNTENQVNHNQTLVYLGKDEIDLIKSIRLKHKNSDKIFASINNLINLLA